MVDGKTIVDFHIGKGSVLLIPKLSTKVHNNPNKIVYTFPIFDTLKRASESSVYPSKKVYGTYDWNIAKTNFVITKTKKEKLYASLVRFHKVFSIPYRSKDLLSYIEFDIITCIEDMFSWNPLLIYKRYPTLSLDRLFLTYERLKRAFQRAPVYKLMHQSNIFCCTESKLFVTLENYPELLSSNVTVKENRNNSFTSYKAMKSKMDLFYTYISRLSHFEFLEDKTFRISYPLSLNDETIVFHQFVANKKETTQIKRLGGIIQQNIDNETTMIIVQAKDRDCIKKIKEKHKNKGLIGLTIASFCLYFMTQT
jgi:hypothetical protein